MADKLQIPDSFNPLKKVITSPRTAVTIGLSQASSRTKVKILQSQIDSKYDYFGDASVKGIGLGTPVYDQLVIKRAIDTLPTNEQSGDDFVKLDSVIVTINQTRNIVTTPIQGRNGTVKEYISDGDFEINIKGLVVSISPQRAPREIMENIANLFSLPNEIVVVSDYISLFKIDYAVVQSYAFSQVEGSLNQIQMDLRLLSDSPIELKLGIDGNA